MDILLLNFSTLQANWFCIPCYEKMEKGSESAFHREAQSRYIVTEIGIEGDNLITWNNSGSVLIV